jgi:hypothetical protein
MEKNNPMVIHTTLLSGIFEIKLKEMSLCFSRQGKIIDGGCSTTWAEEKFFRVFVGRHEVKDTAFKT